MKNIQPLPPYDLLHKLFSYDRESGLLTRKIKGKGGNAPTGSIVGTPNKAGHLRVKITERKNKNLAFAVHRIIWFMETGTDPMFHDIDHINRIKDDNRWINLRMVSRSENSFNQQKCTTEIYPGVHKRKNRYCARIMIDYVRVNLGSFKTAEEAIRRRKEAEIELARTRKDHVLLILAKKDIDAITESP